ncbi:MAG: hybrid sensor histidine kinase/response regulator [Armatimonadetes bacterium]|nr:hybrid sensor histidine kinase/response regulator [Armatimonadota bacterium]
MDRAGEAPIIMVVDDTPANLGLLEGVLQRRGYRVRAFLSGLRALAAAEAEPPSLILLDVAMPDMDGYEVCRLFKARPDLAHIPVIFITVLEGTEDKVTAVRSGGVDFITKPVQTDELCSRVRAHLSISARQTRLEAHNAVLDAMVAQRTAELAEANQRLALLDEAKGAVIRMITRELRTPLHGVLGIGELLTEGQPPASETAELTGLYQQSCGRLMGIIENAELIAEIDLKSGSSTLVPVGLRQALREAAADARADRPEATIKLQLDVPESAVILGDAHLVRQAFRALIRTAADLGTAELPVTVRCSDRAGGVAVEVEGRGKRLEPEAQEAMTTMLCSAGADAAPSGFWLDPAVAHRILTVFGASVSVRPLDPDGALFVVRLRPAPGQERTVAAESVS